VLASAGDNVILLGLTVIDSGKTVSSGGE